MYHRVRRKMIPPICAILILSRISTALPKNIQSTESTNSKISNDDNNIENNIIDFDEQYSVKFNTKYVPFHSNENFNKESHRYILIKDDKSTKVKLKDGKLNDTRVKTLVDTTSEIFDTTTNDYSVIPLELISTTENKLLTIVESTTEPDYSVIPLSTTIKDLPDIVINQTVTLPTSTENSEIATEDFTVNIETTTVNNKIKISNETLIKSTTDFTTVSNKVNVFNKTTIKPESSTAVPVTTEIIDTTVIQNDMSTEVLNTNSTRKIETLAERDINSSEEEIDVPIFTELDAEDDQEVPEDYYDSKDVVPTTAPKTDALSVLMGLAGSVVESVVESVAERVVPKSIYDLFKRMQRQNEALEAERLRSREENGGLGQFTRGILKTISSGISKPLSQLMAGVRDFGSLDSDRGFVGSLASGVTSVANVATSVVDAFKDRVQAIYPGTVWCGDGHSATARSGDLGLFFFTDTCCRQHDACKIYIKAGETKYGLTNTGLFTRSHCSCDVKFRECLRRTNSLVSAQIGLTYFNVLGPQCFRRAHPIVRCLRRTRITGQKCEEYELDFTKPKMWQWFDNETF
ncbi:uncharacterized protein LOC113511186 [Galleria mellonella]|uniref:phospholipase A2 n=1 Tax=Galleria mellonella TaxID=7137 RepID=A0A6J1WBH2_GALME|nr:uncharacterized protein LOC113511186 [Galleria mellonella]